METAGAVEGDGLEVMVGRLVIDGVAGGALEVAARWPAEPLF